MFASDRIGVMLRRSVLLKVSRVAILIRYLIMKSVVWVLEQPAGSLMPQHPRMQDIFADFTVWQCFLHMGAYGGISAKPTWLWSCHAWVCEMGARRLKAGTVFDVADGSAVLGSKNIGVIPIALAVPRKR